MQPARSPICFLENYSTRGLTSPVSWRRRLQPLSAGSDPPLADQTAYRPSTGSTCAFFTGHGKSGLAQDSHITLSGLYSLYYSCKKQRFDVSCSLLGFVFSFLVRFSFSLLTPVFSRRRSVQGFARR